MPAPVIPAITPGSCMRCGQPIPPPKSVRAGRPSVYCSVSCRTMASRERKRTGTLAPAIPVPALERRYFAVDAQQQDPSIPDTRKFMVLDVNARRFVSAHRTLTEARAVADRREADRTE